MSRRLLPVVLLLALVPAPALAAEGDPAVGWWSRTKLGAGAPAEAPDTVPDGGAQVAGDPGGELSVAALRVEPAAGTVVTGLRLTVARVTGTPDVQVCATAARWQPVDGDRLDAAPPADCSGLTVEATVAEGVLVVDLPPSTDGVVDVRLQPAAGSVFTLDLQPPTAAGVVTAPATGTGAAPPAPAAPAPAAPAPAAPAPAEAGALPPAEAVAPFAPVAPLDPPAVADEPAALPPLVGADAPPVPAQALPPELPGPPPASFGEPAAPVAALLPRPAEGLDGRREQVWALALLAGLLALGAQLYRTPARPAVRLGGVARISRAGSDAAQAEQAAPAAVPAVGRERGVGRFRSVRVRPPVSL